MRSQSRRTILSALLAAGLIVAGCSDDGSGESADASSSTTSTTSTSTTSTSSSTTPSTTSVVDAAGVEGPAEWVPVVVDVYARIHMLDTDPDPARVTEVYSENFGGLADEQETIQFLADEGLHAEGQAPRVIRVQGPTEEAGSSQQFVVTVEYFPFQLVREDGSVFQEITDVPGVVDELLRISPSGPGGTWRVLVKASA